ncbi:uncharacterized protein LOC131951282 isoform X2 [Physella acuta]|nr:uncharacterized protein LOC131951282 isoform X2 [Physella acuta]XP_059169623.1 uncharacterized protein LOC131951282 isoform X2 [Physella acuta]
MNSADPTPDLRAGRKKGDRRRFDSASIASSCGRPENEVSTIPYRSRALRDPEGLVLVSQPHPGFIYPGYPPLAPAFVPFDPILTPETEKRPKHRGRNPYDNLQTLKLRQIVIFMASAFIVAFFIVIFVAVYFGRGFETNVNT